ncbi:MAG TPA: RNA 2',3'-cyclic phosphodiesterase [Ktedonobacterales bacterium]
MTRVFIAVDLDAPTREALARLLRRVAHVLPRARVVAPETLHVTLAFLGELDDQRLAEAIAAAREVAAEAAPFSLAPGHIGIFGPDDAPRVIWLALGGQVRRLIALQRRLAHALEARGFTLDPRPFSPHLTLARLTAPPGEYGLLGLRELRSQPSRKDSWQVDDVRVMRSDLTPAGARYTPLAIIPLGAPN